MASTAMQVVNWLSANGIDVNNATTDQLIAARAAIGQPVQPLAPVAAPAAPSSSAWTWVDPTYGNVQGAGEDSNIFSHPQLTSGGWKNGAGQFVPGSKEAPPVGNAVWAQIAPAVEPGPESSGALAQYGWVGDNAPVAVGRINSQGNNGTLFKGSDGYYFDGKKLGIDDATARAWLDDAAEAAKQERESSNFGTWLDKNGEMLVIGGLAAMATAGFASALAGTAAAEAGAAGWVSAEGGAGYAGGMAADAATAGTVAAAGDAAGTAASTATPGGAAMDTAGFEGIGGSSKGLIDTAITGAGRSAVINGAVQLATTGKIDLSKLAVSATSGGFGSVLGGIIGDATGMPLVGQAAGAVTGAIVGGALSDKAGAVSAGVGAGSTGGSDNTGAPAVNPVNMKFGSSGLIYSPAPRTTDWSTPRLNWSGNA